jgi:membrane-bound metal-dependent hydrolase YbcI (DUF457 family)
MKGITHFCAGIAVASCFPYAIETASSGNPICFIIAGIMAAVPDTIDFKFLCFVKFVDYRIIPEYENFDPDFIAEKVAEAAHQCHLTNKKKRIRLCSVRTSAEDWFEYSISFRGNEIIVKENSDKKSPKKGTAKCLLPFHCSYDATTTATIFVGPTITLTPEEGYTQVDFIDWHRGFSHSFAMAIVLSVLISIFINTTVGIIALAAYGSHILLDQFGHMGSAILWPFKKTKISGCSLCHSSSRFANIFTVAVSTLIVFANIFYFQYPSQALNAFRIVLIPTIIMLIYKKIKLTRNENS